MGEDKLTNKRENLIIDTPEGDAKRVPLELCNGRAYISQGIGVDSALELLSKAMLRWWRKTLQID